MGLDNGVSPHKVVMIKYLTFPNCFYHVIKQHTDPWQIGTLTLGFQNSETVRQPIGLIRITQSVAHCYRTAPPNTACPSGNSFNNFSGWS